MVLHYVFGYSRALLATLEPTSSVSSRIVVILSSASYAHELTESHWHRTRLAWCLLQNVHKSLYYHVVRKSNRAQIRPLGHLCAGRGMVCTSGPAGSGYVSPQHVLGTLAAAPSRLRASVRGEDLT